MPDNTRAPGCYAGLAVRFHPEDGVAPESGYHNARPETENDLKPPVKEDASIPSYKKQGVRMVSAPEEGPRFVTEKSSLGVREEVVDTDRLRSLLNELEEMQRRAQEIKRRQQEIKTELMTLMKKL